MTSSFKSCVQTIRQLNRAVSVLEQNCGLLQLAPLAEREWYQLLQQKLLPQIESQAFLVVAVVGGTNIGKSVVFNHLAGCRASSTSALASGTKHPVCLVPEGFSDHHNLDAIFPGFRLRKWSSSDQALEETDEDLIFWRTSRDTPPNLLVLDTPDIDSDARINWKRADGIRRCADVLIAILTQQKYNDAAVKEFFRKAAAEDKAVLVLFNQCQLPEDDEYWPLWLNTFTRETGVQPEFVYIAPNDRTAAENNRLQFFERTWPVDPQQPTSTVARSINEDLSKLHFDEIKIRTLRGSLAQLVDDRTGIAPYLEEVKSRSRDFQSASSRLSEEGVVKVTDWPTVPNSIVVTRVRDWWRTRQDGWSRKIQDTYDTVGNGILWPFRFVRKQIQGDPLPPLEDYRKREWAAVLKSIEEVYDKLTWMSESGSELLRPRLEHLLAGKSRSELIERLKAEQQAIDLEAELSQTVDREMEAFQIGSPELYTFYRQLNNISAAARPVASVVLFTLGWGPAGEVVAPMLADAATHAVAPVVADLAGGAAVAVAGDAAVSGAAGQGLGFLQAKFQRLRSAFMTMRVNWLVGRLKSDLLGKLPDEFRLAGDVPESQPFLEVKRLLESLRVEV
ncbi:MAG: 50S ribosome-binding GTPase [Planctomycetota bacterium]|nr:50S ribosome-binding GTPase [Planctomycetota bacterium]